MKIKIISENTVHDGGLLAEHGLTIWFEYNGRKYLFDTGQGLVLLHNAEKMGIDFQNLDGVIISHDHDDHAGGLKQVLQHNPKLKVWAHPEIIDNHELIKKSSGVKEPTEIREEIWLTGEIPVGVKIFKKKKYKEAAETENSLYVKSEKGLIVLVGCSHPGIINVLDYIEEITDGEKIYAVIGGMHLINKDKQELIEIIDRMNESEIEKLYPMHCTGDLAIHEMINKFKGEVLLSAAGKEIELEV